MSLYRGYFVPDAMDPSGNNIPREQKSKKGKVVIQGEWHNNSTKGQNTQINGGQTVKTGAKYHNTQKAIILQNGGWFHPTVGPLSIIGQNKRCQVPFWRSRRFSRCMMVDFGVF